MRTIDHEYTENIVCPNCGEIFNSFEKDDYGTEYCDKCDTEFEYCRNVEVTYSTRIKDDDE